MSDFPLPLILAYRRLHRKKNTQRSIYIKAINKGRKLRCEMQLINEMRFFYDTESYYKYFRMNESAFDALLLMVEPLIQHAPTIDFQSRPLNV